jgi:hypothetical protein
VLLPTCTVTPLLLLLLTCLQVAQGCHMLEEALHVLEASEPVAPALVKEIRGGLASLQGPRILDVLRGPLDPDTEAARRKAVNMLRMLTSQQPPADGSSGVVTADSVKLLVGAMSPQEILEMADWMEVARKDKTLPWWVCWGGGGVGSQQLRGFSTCWGGLLRDSGLTSGGICRCCGPYNARSMSAVCGWVEGVGWHCAGGPYAAENGCSQ